MCDGIVIDGHVIRNLKSELIVKSGMVYSLVSWITSNCGIAVNDYIVTHWEQHCGSRARNLLFWEWYFDELYNKRTIHFIRVKRLNGRSWRKFQAKFKIPVDPFIRTAIECADSTSEPRYILAEDMYLYDAEAKARDPNTQENIRENRAGPICKYLEKTLNIIVGTPKHCKEYFEIDKGICSCNSLNNINCPRVSMS